MVYKAELVAQDAYVLRDMAEYDVEHDQVVKQQEHLDSSNNNKTQLSNKLN